MRQSLFFLYLLFILCVPHELAAKSSRDQEREFLVINAANGLADNSAQIVKCTHTGRMIISALGNVNFYDGATFTHIDTRQDYQLSIPAYRGDYQLNFDHFHHIWLKNKGTVTCVDLYMEQFNPDPKKVVREMGCSDPIQDVFVDSIGDVWFLTAKGLYDVKTKKTLDVLPNQNLQELETRGDTLYLFYGNGEEVALGRENGRLIHHTFAYDEETARKYQNSSVMLHTDSVFYMIRSGDGGSALLSFNHYTLKWNVLMELPYHMHDLALHDESLYFATDYGYFTFDRNNGDVEFFDELAMVGGRTLKIACHAICFDRQGGLWIGTEDRGVLYGRPGLSPIHSYDRNHPKAQEYIARMAHLKQNITEFQGRQANCRFTDSRKWTWFGTTTGVYLYKSPDAKPILFNKKKGLLNEVVHSVVEDKNGNIWLSTSYGITCIMIENGDIGFINSYNAYDNVPNESFLNCKSMCLEDGMIIMESIDHVISFNPSLFTTINKNNQLILSPKLIRLMVNGNFVEAGESVDGNVIIDRAITRAWDIWLKSDQNTITLTFSGLNYYRPIQTCYRVRVSGFDNQWRVYSYFSNTGHVDSQGRLHLPMVGLKPGTYEVEVQTSMFPDQWDIGNPYKWTIHVDQPWWQATIVYVLLILIIIVFVVLNLFLYSTNTRLRARLNAGESVILKKVNAFIDRLNAYDNELLAPLEEELLSRKFEAAPSSEFVNVMNKLSPYLKSHPKKVSMRVLSELSGMDIVALHALLSANIYKSPRSLIMLLRLDKAADLLKTTQMSVEEIAAECKFYTPNFFIGNFYHLYKATPQEYRLTHAR